MSKGDTKPISQSAQLMLESLRKSVAEALEKKRRLGQYAVVWEDGKPVMIRGDQLSRQKHLDAESCSSRRRPGMPVNLGKHAT